MCFILECITGLRLRQVAPTLSQKRHGGSGREIGVLVGVILPMQCAVVRAWYSALMDDWAIAFCL